MENRVLPVLRERAGGSVGRRRVLRIAGMGESAVEELVAPVYAKWKDDPVTILASPGEVQLHLAVRGEPEVAEARLSAMEEDFRAVLGARIFGEDSEDLPAVVGRLLRERRRTISFAESCTGGLVSSMLTDVPGASEYSRVGRVLRERSQGGFSASPRDARARGPSPRRRRGRWRSARGRASTPTSPYR
jgi:nicotinamide-nucleotide amidase